MKKIMLFTISLFLCFYLLADDNDDADTTTDTIETTEIDISFLLGTWVFEPIIMIQNDAFGFDDLYFAREAVHLQKIEFYKNNFCTIYFTDGTDKGYTFKLDVKDDIHHTMRITFNYKNVLGFDAFFLYLFLRKHEDSNYRYYYRVGSLLSAKNYIGIFKRVAEK